MRQRDTIRCIYFIVGLLAVSLLIAEAQEPFEFEMSPSIRGVLSDDSIRQLQDALKPLHAASSILQTNPGLEPSKISEALGIAQKALDSIERKSLVLQPDDPLALFWTSVLSDAWCITGWAALESGDLPQAETYLSASWRLSQDKTSGMELARVRAAEGKTAEAMHLYELASVVHIDNPMGLMGSSFPTNDEIAEKYRLLAGHALPDSKDQIKRLEDEVGQQNSIPEFVHSTKLEGNAVFLVTFRAGRSNKASWYLNDQALTPAATALESPSLESFLPTGSKANLLREAYVSCGPAKGCSAYLRPPTDMDFPGSRVNWKVFYPSSSIPFKTAEIKLE